MCWSRSAWAAARAIWTASCQTARRSRRRSCRGTVTGSAPSRRTASGTRRARTRGVRRPPVTWSRAWATSSATSRCTWQGALCREPTGPSGCSTPPPWTRCFSRACPTRAATPTTAWGGPRLAGTTTSSCSRTTARWRATARAWCCCPTVASAWWCSRTRATRLRGARSSSSWPTAWCRPWPATRRTRWTARGMSTRMRATTWCTRLRWSRVRRVRSGWVAGVATCGALAWPSVAGAGLAGGGASAWSRGWRRGPRCLALRRAGPPHGAFPGETS